MKQNLDLDSLSADRDFVRRHIGPGDSEQQKMLKSLGYKNVEELVAAVIPSSILQRDSIDNDMPAGISEQKLLARLEGWAQQNKQLKSFIGQGYYNNQTPEAILSGILGDPGWFTAYTPYQAEISQGRLEALANYQTMVMDLTGMDIANASLLDEGTAAAEAMGICLRASKKKGQQRFFVADNCHPQTIDVIRGRAKPLAVDVLVGKPEEMPEDICGALFQYPDTFGHVEDYSKLIEKAHAQGTLVTLASDLLALCVMKTPAELGADIALGSAQRFGVPLGFGGPHAAFMAVTEKLQRSLPGRIIGVSKDRYGKPAYRMSLQTREQHIRREKATSNICTAQALLAIIAGFYAVYFGPKGLRRNAERTNALAMALAAGLEKLGYSLHSRIFFDTVVFDSKGKSKELLQKALDAGYNLRFLSDSHLGVSLDDAATVEDVAALLSAFGLTDTSPENIQALAQSFGTSLPAEMLRKAEYLSHGVFHKYHSETNIIRYMRHLANKDIALDRAMIPLGSCTMKLNAPAEMKALSFSGFSKIHPFAPHDQTTGYLAMIEELKSYLCKLTGYDAFSLQPNAGSQGEFAGLLAIHAYHASLGQAQRNISLIPVSAHGTNPASAQMAGLKVLAVACDKAGNIDLEDLKLKCEKHKDELSCIMITYPSTHGVFEQNIREVCETVHQFGGQVYIDGANLNAQVGLAYPGLYGGDVSHLNLHKTFAIPHGGGGPGIGPIGVKKHLEPFLPGHCVVDNGHTDQFAVAAAPWGSASILTITYAYIAMLGSQGLRKASEVAILSANYIAKRLDPYFPVLYKGKHDLVAHECILDIRPFEKEVGVSAEDIAKRLMDYGLHAPTMSFPVPGTLMVEPTESEPLEEVERFINAMISIHGEIEELRSGKANKEDNVLHNAPHSMEEITANEWTHSYSREQAAFPMAGLKEHKIWPGVGRIDNVYGDKNLFCSCVPMSEYEG